MKETIETLQRKIINRQKKIISLQDMIIESLKIEVALLKGMVK